jgi:hypothetical protein
MKINTIETEIDKTGGLQMMIGKPSVLSESNHF